MSIKAVGSGDRIRVPAGTTDREIGVLVRDASNAPVAGVPVVFEAKNSGAVFPDAAGRAAQTVKTDANGEAWSRIQPVPGGPRLFDVTADAGTHGMQTFGIEVTSATPYDRGGTAPMPPPQPSGSSGILWPVVVLLGIIIAGALLWKALDRSSSVRPDRIVIDRGGSGSTVDPTARADAQAARAAVERTAADLRQELDSGLTATTTHAEGHAREGDRELYRAVHPRLAGLEHALKDAQRIAEGRGDLTADGRSTICVSDPSFRNHPTCRE